MIVSVANETVVVPLSAILEMLQARGRAKSIRSAPTETVVQVRGEFVPVIDVGHQLGFGAAHADYRDRSCSWSRPARASGARWSSTTIQDQRQVVIKGLEENYGDVSGRRRRDDPRRWPHRADPRHRRDRVDASRASAADRPSLALAE